MVSLAKLSRRFDQRFEYRLQVKGRAADDLEHIGSGGLLLQRLAQLVEQARVLDGDDGLGSEALDQLDLLVGEWADLLAEDGDSADQFTLFEHRDHEQGPDTSAFDGYDGPWIAFGVRLPGREIGNVDHLFRCCHAGKSSFRAGTPWRALAFLHQHGRRIMMRYKVKLLAVTQIQISKIGRADARRACQHGVKHRLQFARRAGDDT